MCVCICVLLFIFDMVTDLLHLWCRLLRLGVSLCGAPGCLGDVDNLGLKPGTHVQISGVHIFINLLENNIPLRLYTARAERDRLTGP